MVKQNINPKKGFTIIEVVLVLAIAGLIFLMVFVALPALQRTQRDTQRRNDYAMLSTSVTQYMVNHNSKLPVKTTKNYSGDYSCESGFGTKQINTNGTDPSGKTYTLHCDHLENLEKRFNGSFFLQPYDGTNGPFVYVISGAKCEDGKPVESNSNDSVVYGQLESGTYCQDNQ